MRTWAEIDLDNLVYNLNKIKEFAGEREILGVIKTNGYGMGAVECAQELYRNGVRIFGVACYDEAFELHKAGVPGEILIFGCISPENMKGAAELGFHMTISSFDEIRYMEENNLNPKIHVKVDTGMGRIGFPPEEAMEAIEYLRSKKIGKVEGVYSHLSVADMPEEDEYTLMQLEKFERFQKLDDIKYRHILNSCGALRFGEEAGGTNLVRVGIILYGIVPFQSELQKEFRHVFTFKTKVLFVKKISEKSYISYGKSEVAHPGEVIATIGVGYGDGFSRKFSNGGEVMIHGVKCRIVGRVCMDMTMVRIPEEIQDRVVPGTEVTLVGEDILEKAESIGTIPYEIMTGIGGRVARFYIKNGKVVGIKSLKEVEKIKV